MREMHAFNLLTSPVLLLGAGFLIILACRRLQISPIVGFLIGGVALGPHGIDVVPENEITEILAELAVVFLLFDIGLHFSMRTVWVKRNTLFGIAPLQMLITAIVLGCMVAFAFGVGSDFALLAGTALALSSTAVVMRLLQDMKLQGTQTGQSAKAILIFQDVVAIFLLIFADAAGGDESLAMTVAIALGKAVLAFIAAVVLGRHILTPLMRSITGYQDPELLTVLSLFLVMVTALMTAQVGLSLTLGAFLAGMVMAETPYRGLLQDELRPFRNLLMGFFFIKIGMMLEPGVMLGHADVVIGFVLMLVAVKTAILVALAFIFRRTAGESILLAFLLCQGSEFAFVIFSMASVQAGFDIVFVQALVAAIGLSMMLSPPLSYLAYRACLHFRIEGADEIKSIRAYFTDHE